jgi:hypothetical protein
MIEQIVAIALLCGLLGAIGCMVVKIAQAKCWTYVNRNYLMPRAMARYRSNT